MPGSEFVKEYNIPESFRNNKIKSMFDYNKETSFKKFSVNIPIEEKDWNIGLIVGSSGSGKTTIGRECFPDFYFFEQNQWDNTKTIVDNFSQSFSANEIVEILSKVGLSSPPEWLKPYNILSNGQKFRVDLARAVLESEKPLIFDEFTSVVDRQVAQIGSFAISKFVRKYNKQFIALSCHYDIIDWLQPNWVFNTDLMQFQWRELRRRPEIRLDIRKANYEEWQLFKQYHYLKEDINTNSVCYIAEINNIPVAFLCYISHFGRPANRKRIHRFVVLPDYQGIGIGKALLDFFGHFLKQRGYVTVLVSSNPALIFGLQKDRNWEVVRKPSYRSYNMLSKLGRTASYNRITASFRYTGN